MPNLAPGAGAQKNQAQAPQPKKQEYRVTIVVFDDKNSVVGKIIVHKEAGFTLEVF